MGKMLQKNLVAATAPGHARPSAAEVSQTHTSARRARAAGRGPQDVSAAGERLLASTGRLAKAMSDFAVSASAGAEPPPIAPLREAYASIVKLLPQGTRLQFLGAMRQGIDEVARAVSGDADPAQEERQGVTTADFMAGLRQQEEAYRQHAIATGELLPGSELQRRLKVTPQALSAAVKRKRLFALKGASGKNLYPAFFADAAYDRATLERVSQALGDLPGSTKLHFFTSARESLRGLTPLQALAKGNVDAVLDQAHATREA